MIIPHQMKGKSVAILGLGRSGMGACHALLAAEAKCYIYDDHQIPDHSPKGAMIAAPDAWPWAKLDGLKLTDCAILIPTQQNSLGLAPFMAYSKAGETGMTIPESFVMFMVDPVDELKAQYQNMFSKVITPNKKIIL